MNIPDTPSNSVKPLKNDSRRSFAKLAIAKYFCVKVFETKIQHSCQCRNISVSQSCGNVAEYWFWECVCCNDRLPSHALVRTTQHESVPMSLSTSTWSQRLNVNGKVSVLHTLCVYCIFTCKCLLSVCFAVYSDQAGLSRRPTNVWYG